MAIAHCAKGWVAAMRSGAMRQLPPEALTGLLAAAFDRAALAIDAGADPRDYRVVLEALLDGLAGTAPSE